MKNVACACVLSIALAALAGGCGDDGPSGSGAASGSAPAAKDAQARAVVEKLFELARAGRRAEAAGYIAYRGRDKERKWRDANNYEAEDEKRAVDRVCGRIASYLELGEPVFGKFESERESEGEWLVWHVTFGEGESAKKVAFACIDNAGRTLLGDID